MMNKGTHLSLTGTQLDLGDYVIVQGVWVKLVTEHEVGRMMRNQARRFIAVDRTGAERVVLVYTSRAFKAFRMNR